MVDLVIEVDSPSPLRIISLSKAYPPISRVCKTPYPRHKAPQGFRSQSGSIFWRVTSILRARFRGCELARSRVFMKRDLQATVPAGRKKVVGMSRRVFNEAFVQGLGWLEPRADLIGFLL